MGLWKLAALPALLLSTAVQAAVPRIAAPAPYAVTSRNGTELPPLNTTYYFDQLIDHKNPSLGTFKQRYWFTYENYESGGPIIMMTPGEANAAPYTSYLTNKTINGLIAQQENGAILLFENRFYGLSNPYPNLSVASLKYHTLDQAIDDVEHMARTIVLPMPGGDKVTPDVAPWIITGGSYSGALVAWTMTSKPGMFAAGWSSSGVVEAITDYWTYFLPIRQGMPKNCSHDVIDVIKHVDQTFLGTNQTAIAELKEILGMSEVSHLYDVAGALRNNLWDWQSLSPTSNGGKFYEFCDALEVKDGVSADKNGWGLEHALPAWGKYLKSGYLAALCGEQTFEQCLGTFDGTGTYWTDEGVDNVSRSWFWTVCTEVGWFQTSAPKGKDTLVSRLVLPADDERQCRQMFPKAFATNPTPNVELTNTKYHGWGIKVDHLLFVNGKNDPWRESTMSTEKQDLESTDLQPILIGDGFHCSDLNTRNAVDPSIANIHVKGLKTIGSWLKDFKGSPLYSRPAATLPTGPSVRLPASEAAKRAQVLPRPINAWFRMGEEL